MTIFTSVGAVENSCRLNIHHEGEFDVEKPNKKWVTNFTYVRAYEGWLYFTIVVGLVSRQVIGWTMKDHPTVDLGIDALLMAVWRRKPEAKIWKFGLQGGVRYFWRFRLVSGKYTQLQQSPQRGRRQ